MMQGRFTRIGQYTVIAPVHTGGVFTIYHHAGDMVPGIWKTFESACTWVLERSF